MPGPRDPLFRTGHQLTASSLLTAGIGALYWVIATHLFGPTGIGRGYAAVSAMMFLGGVGQLNLVNTMIRFAGPAGHGARRLAGRAYLAAAGCGLVLGAGFVALTPRLAAGLVFLRTPALGAGFAAATAGYAIFVLQDGVLTGLRRAHWVVAENALFATVKVVLLLLAAAGGALTAILGSWWLGLVCSLAFTNSYLFGRALPRSRHPAAAAPRVRAAAGPGWGYLAADWGASMCWLAATTLPPVIVLDRLGAAAGAYFSIAWLVAYSLYQFAINMSSSLIVEAGGSPAALRRHCLRVLRHSGVLLAAAVVVVAAGAPWLLRVFGAAYAREGTTTLRLLALSALPNLLVCVVVAACRVRRRMRLLMGTLSVQAVLVLGLTMLLLGPAGPAGAGLAWLLAQWGLAGWLLHRRSAWLPDTAQSVPHASGPGLLPLSGLLPISRPAALRRPADAATARRLAARVDPEHLPELHRGPQGGSDVLVFRLDDTRGVPLLAVKHPRSPQAAATLARERTVLERLAADTRLAEWHRLLPLPAWTRLDEPLPLATQRWLPGVSAERHLNLAPERAAPLTAAALAAVRELHRATGRREPGAERVDSWLGQRRALLTAQVAWCRTEPGAAGLEALCDLLRDELSGRPLTVSWVHGDFAPGNVLLDDRGTTATGLIDWSSADAAAPAALDACTFALALRCRLDHRTWGSLATDVLRAGGLSAEDLALLGPEADETDAVDELTASPALPLLAWLWHVSSNTAKSPRYGRSRWWVTANIVPVLTEVARCAHC